MDSRDQILINRYSREFDTEAYVGNGVVRWRSNNQVPPAEVLNYFVQAGKEFDLEKSTQAREKEYEEFIKQYKKNMVAYTPSEEDLAEMRSAFGSGETVVNVITGQRIKL